MGRNHQFLGIFALIRPTTTLARPFAEIAAPIAIDCVDNPRHRHAAAMCHRLLVLPAHQQRKIDRLRHEQHQRDRKDKLADQAARPQTELHAAGPIRFTSHASV